MSFPVGNWVDPQGNLFTCHNEKKARDGSGPFGTAREASGYAANHFAKWTPDGKLAWVVGRHAPGNDWPEGHARSLFRIDGGAHGCIAVNDVAESKLHVWDHDGLWVGRLFENPVTNGEIPPAAYNICNENFGGTFYIHPGTKQTYFLAGGDNASVLYRITGLENLQRQSGTLTLP